LRIKRISLKNLDFKKGFIPLGIAVILLGSADFSFNFAISRGLTTIVAPIADSYPALFVLLAFLIFKDPIKKQQIFSIVTTLFGIILLSVFSGVV